ncbi:enoyl-CoA hydratase/isomerase family protein [Yinghuangia sp. YIM S09857]|uniref:enoyl-CoA hydratase/isomerase family protein n=1 Tax=Yinghuangia sp. YIM S09857 TaxID=3436929 RepID=UPI003F52FB78
MVSEPLVSNRLSIVPVPPAALLASSDLLQPAVSPTDPPRGDDVLTIVDLDEGAHDPGAVARILGDSTRLTLGIARGPWDEALQPVVNALTLTLCLPTVAAPGRAHVPVPDPAAAAAEIAAAVHRTPRAALALGNVLRINAGLIRTAGSPGGPLGLADAVATESLAYSALLAGPEFAAWRAAHPPRREPPVPSDAVLLEREGDVLRITLNRPDRRNALGHGLRDALIDGLDVLAADPTLRAELRGAGPSFSSGGDLDEFGTAADPATAHVVRLARSAGLRVHRDRDRVTPYLHGACVGAGIEVPAFAATVVAAPDAWCQLPELSLGLIPGAGGTASVTARIGRWRTAWMTLTGARLSAQHALAWGLVDRVEPSG